MKKNLTTEQVLQQLLMKGRLRQFQMIIEVAAIGNMHQAARRLAVSQPAVTKAIQDIEDMFELPIFERHSRGMRLTPLGREVLPYLRRIADTTRRCAEAVALRHNTGSSTIRVGAVAAGLNGLLAHHLPGFAEANPLIHVKVREIDGRQIQALLSEGEFDLLVCRAPELVPGQWKFIPLLADEHAVFAAPHHPLAKRKRLTIDDLSDAVWLTPPQGVPALAVFEQVFTSIPASNLCQIATRSAVVIREALRQRQALAIAPISIFQSDLAAGSLVQIDFDLGSAVEPVGLLVGRENSGEASQRLVRYLVQNSAVDPLSFAS